MRHYAEDTSVPVARSRGAIDELLRGWSCTKIGWMDEFDERRAQLQFVWVRGNQQYLARFTLPLPKADEVKKRLTLEHRHRWVPSQTKVDETLAQGDRSAYRVLFLWLKAALNAVASGIITAEAVFLPWLVGSDGRTVAEVAVPQLERLLGGSADRLLPEPR